MQNTEKDEKAAVKSYLSRYHRICNRRNRLEERLVILRAQIPGTGAITYSDMPKGTDFRDQNAEFTIRQQELITQIDEQRAAAVQAMQDIIAVVAILPEESEERAILELRHIDNKCWEDIAKTESLSIRQCIRYWNEGLIKILKDQTTRGKIMSWAEEERI